MDPAFWIERWRDNRIAFHEGRPNTFLTAHADRLPPGRVLVPLCGKTEDMAFLAARGHSVVGIELVEDAARQFFAEHALEPTITPRGAMVEYAAKGITFLAGDVFAATRELTGTIDAIYDRAALVALPPQTRPRYLDQLRALAGAGTPGLLVVVEYPEDAMSGPPFSVREPELRRLYPRLELLETHPFDSGGKLRERAVEAVERLYVTAL